MIRTTVVHGVGDDEFFDQTPYFVHYISTDVAWSSGNSERDLLAVRSLVGEVG